MPGEDDVIGGEIETPVAFVIDRVSAEGISDGSGCQFMSCLGGEIGIAGATELGGGDTVESDITAGYTNRLAGKMVQQIRGCVESIYPVVN
jgi:hypothetical protein